MEIIEYWLFNYLGAIVIGSIAIAIGILTWTRYKSKEEINRG